MNIIRIYGGLGNQLFQYAFGKLIESRGREVGFDVAWYNKKDGRFPRPLRLDKFVTHYETVRMYFKNDTIHENGLLPSISMKGNYNYIGYWQSPLYYEGIYNSLQNEFWVRSKYYTEDYLRMKEKVMQCNSVAVHVRRGDFLGHKEHLVLPLEYYNEAISIISSLREDIQIFVFSDGIDWCRKNFKGENITFVQMEDYLEFDLMRYCKSKITANSTFSWWPAYLDKEGIIVTPERWWVNEKETLTMQAKKFLPDRWIKLKI